MGVASRERFPLPNDVFQLGLKSGELLVYIYLQHQKGAHGDQCWPSYSTIGEAVRMSRKTVQKYIGTLIDKELVRAEYGVWHRPYFWLSVFYKKVSCWIRDSL